MSDVMLFGVLRMPYEMAMVSELSRLQFHDRAQQACDAIEALQAEREALRADAERLRIRGEAYETAYGIAYQATYQSHNGHWDATMRGGLGCRECIKAREARENCDAALRDGLENLIERAAKGQGS